LQAKCSHKRNLLEQRAPEVLLEPVVRLAQLRLRLEVVQLAVQQELEPIGSLQSRHWEWELQQIVVPVPVPVPIGMHQRKHRPWLQEQVLQHYQKKINPLLVRLELQLELVQS